jgi:hypothetical protein
MKSSVRWDPTRVRRKTKTWGTLRVTQLTTKPTKWISKCKTKCRKARACYSIWIATTWRKSHQSKTMSESWLPTTWHLETVRSILLGRLLLKKIMCWRSSNAKNNGIFKINIPVTHLETFSIQSLHASQMARMYKWIALATTSPSLTKQTSYLRSTVTLLTTILTVSRTT